MPHTTEQLEADSEYLAYTRRQILAKGSQLAIALMTANCLLGSTVAEASDGKSHDDAVPIEATSPMQKALNSPDWRNVPENSNRNAAAYVKDPANKIGTVVVWALGMDEAMPKPGHWDEQAFIAQTKKSRPPEDKNVIVAIPSQFPGHITGGGERAPIDRSPNGPLGEYYERVIEQHSFAGAFVCGNEVNYAFADQPKNSAKHAAEMMVTFDKLLKHHNRHNTLLLAPGIADGGDANDYGYDYAYEFMMALQATGHTFYSPAAFAIHTYTAVKHNHVGGVRKMFDLIDNNWIGSQNELYIPETGYEFEVVPSAGEFALASPQRVQESWQKRNLIRHFKWCQEQMGKVAACTQYMLQDDPLADFQSALYSPDGEAYPVEEFFSKI